MTVWPSHRLARPPWRLWLWSKRNKGWAAAIALALLAGAGMFAATVEREQAKERQLQLLKVQRIQQSDHQQGWSQDTWQRIAGLNWKTEDRGVAQGLAVAARSGLDVRIEKELPIYAQSLTFAPDGQLWLGHTGSGANAGTPRPIALICGPSN